MDDSCAVCAESLEWVAYGACGHREVCSTCVARLRFICDDLRCCICKSESNSVFVTKALGDYTKTINDFSVFPVNPTEGKNGLYWYHEDTGAFFDDSEHYRHIKAMCKLSCSQCDKAEEQGGNEGQRRRGKYRNIEQLKGHLFHAHKLIMCSLCLEGRKIFICEQKLYTRAQLNQHIRTGDSEVDGSESERGGFMGHPNCEFCRKPFYGDNELYTHMSTEHYTCHICQRQNPGQFDYYKNYDDLEMHFRHLHFLCEDEACLAKKFIVFTSEPEMKRHNAIEHGGNMSRSKRNSALQIPTSFRYRRDSEQDDRRGRGRGRGRGQGRGQGFYSNSSEDQLSMAIQFSFESSNTDNMSHGPTSSTQTVSDPVESMIDEIVPPFESLGTTDSERSSRYLQALGHSSAAPLQEASFPPLAMGSLQQTIRQDSEGPSTNTMAARLRRRNKGTVNVLNSANAWPARNSASTSSRSVPTANYGLLSSSNPAGSSQSKPAVPNVLNSANGWPATSSASSSSSRSRLTPNSGNVSLTPASSSQSRPAITNGSMSSSYANLAQARPATGNGRASSTSGSSWNVSSTSHVSHSASAPNLVERASMDSSMSDFPPVSATLKNKLPTTTNSPPVPEVVQDVHKANKSLVEMIRSSLQDDDRFAAFKDISAEYRQGVIDSWEYMSYVQQFGLTHLVLELARLCPDPRKQRELLDAYNTSVRAENKRESESSNNSRSKVSKGSIRGKANVEDATKPKDVLADNILDTVRKLQAGYKPSEEEVEVLPKDGYRRASNGKSKTSITQEQLRPNSANRKPPDSDGQNSIQSAVGSSQNPVGAADGGGGGKQKKKTPKFLRVRLGDASAAAAALSGQLDSGPEQEEETSNSEQNSSEGVPVRGVWRNGGGQKLVSLTQKRAGK